MIRVDDGAGNILLSRREANEEQAWEKLKEMMEEGTTVTVRIKESVKAGVVAYLEGIRAFIPASPDHIRLCGGYGELGRKRDSGPGHHGG